MNTCLVTLINLRRQLHFARGQHLLPRHEFKTALPSGCRSQDSTSAMEGGLSSLKDALEAAELHPFLTLYRQHVSKSNHLC